MDTDQTPLDKTSVYQYSSFRRAAGLIFSAGMIAYDFETKTVIAGGIKQELGMLLAQLDKSLKSFGLCKSDILSVKVFTTDLSKMPLINLEWETYFAGHKTLPTRTTVGVSELPKQANIEIECILEDPNS